MKRRKFLQHAGGVVASSAIVASVCSPAIAKGVKEMTIVSTWPRDFPGIGISAQRFASRVTELSEGRIKTTYYAAGEKVGAFDVFDDVAAGNSQAYSSAEYYWKGKNPALAFFTTVPFGMTVTERNAWLKFGGGQELWDELSDQFGLKALPCGATGTQMGGWFNKEILTVDDLKGLKMRIPGLGGDVMAKLGASPVSLPGNQIFENLMSGAIDATEWIGPYNDYFMKFYEAAKFYYWSGMHEPSSMLSLGMNKKWWSSLSKWEQNIITAAAMEENASQYEEAQAKNGKYLAKMINENGIILKSFDDDIYDALAEAATEVIEEVRDYNAFSKKVHDHFFTALKKIGSWQNISEIAYSVQRNRILGLQL
ncbi:MAG: Monocarboxylate 2-oxoacid-binding periplasmic protein [Hyphomicrobiaceae bacterium hypho_1]